MKPEDLFRAEKERAVSARNSQHARLLAEAKAAFDKLMAEGQAARKSGRPRKHPLPPLKTSSSRPAARPTPAPAAKVVAPKPVVPAAPAKPAAKKPAAAKAGAKRETKPAKSARRTAPTKSKGKRSPRR